MKINKINITTLKTLSVILPLCMVMPSESLNMPLCFIAINVFFLKTFTQFLVAAVYFFCFFLYPILSSAYKYKSLADNIILSIIQLAFLIILFYDKETYYLYGNWVNYVTLIPALVVSILLLYRCLKNIYLRFYTRETQF